MKLLANVSSKSLDEIKDKSKHVIEGVIMTKYEIGNVGQFI